MTEAWAISHIRLMRWSGKDESIRKNAAPAFMTARIETAVHLDLSNSKPMNFSWLWPSSTRRLARVVDRASSWEYVKVPSQAAIASADGAV